MIPTMKTVLAVTDLSEYGDRCVPYAYALVSPGGTVHIAHVLEPLVLPNPMYAHYSPGKAKTPEERAAQRKEIENGLRALVPGEAASLGIRTEVHVLEGSLVSDVIIDTGRSLAVDGVCIGSHGRTGVMKVLMGSVAESVLRKIHRPLLIVRPK